MDTAAVPLLPPKMVYDLTQVNQVAVEMAEEIQADVVSCQGAVCKHR